MPQARDYIDRNTTVSRSTRLYQTIRHLRARQIYGRAFLGIRRKLSLRMLPDPPVGLVGFDPGHDAGTHYDPWNTRSDILRGRFTFLNEPSDLGRPVDWEPSDKSLLWCFNLHYFNYLFLLDPGERLNLCRDWISANTSAVSVAWHPYTTSLRIVNWCRAGLDDREFLESLYRQSSYLYRNLETYLEGNHLLENARALVVAGSYFRGQGESERWLEAGLALFRSQLEEQVLPDGVHYERSPMYHSLMLAGILDVLCAQGSRTPNEDLVGVANRMSDFVISMQHPDGSLARFNDTVDRFALPPARLLEYVKSVTGYDAQERTCFSEGGYFVYRDDDVYLVVDGGPLGPDHLPGHAHADIFSYELSVRGQRIIVDTGVYEYASGSMRSFSRSTSAHNTVTVDEENQAELWGAFRVARRFAPEDVICSEGDGSFSFRGMFDGYSKLIGDDIRHVRTIELSRDRRQILVEDAVAGVGQHLVESRIHIHPDAEIIPSDDGFTLAVRDTAVQVRLRGCPARLEDGWYCPEFGVKQRSSVIVVGGESVLPIEISYAISWE